MQRSLARDQARVEAAALGAVALRACGCAVAARYDVLTECPILMGDEAGLSLPQVRLPRCGAQPATHHPPACVMHHASRDAMSSCWCCAFVQAIRNHFRSLKVLNAFDPKVTRGKSSSRLAAR